MHFEQLGYPSMNAADVAKRINREGAAIYLTGPAASGKSTTAKLLSENCKLALLDTGLFFRLAALLVLNEPNLINQPKVLASRLRQYEIQIKHDIRIFLEEREITEILQSRAVEAAVAEIALNPATRGVVLSHIRRYCRGPMIIAARSSTDAITQGPFLQIGLTADFQTRLVRRSTRMKSDREDEFSLRCRDSTESGGPLQFPACHTLNNSNLSADETADAVLKRISLRLDRIENGFRLVRKVPLKNPIFTKCIEFCQSEMEEVEGRLELPSGLLQTRFAFGLARFRATELFEQPIETPTRNWWDPIALPSGPLKLNRRTLSSELEQTAHDTAANVWKFRSASKPLRGTLHLDAGLRFQKAHLTSFTDRELNFDDVDNLECSTRFCLTQVSASVGNSIEEHLHYMGEPRTDSIARFAIWDKELSKLVYYASFVWNSSSYLEPALWRIGLSLDQVATLSRAFGFPNCPKNLPAFALRMFSKILSKRYRHVKAIITDVNPNIGFLGTSFYEAGFKRFALKPAKHRFCGRQFVSRRKSALAAEPGPRSGEISSDLPLLPNLTLLKPIHSALQSEVRNMYSTHEALILPEDYSRWTQGGS